MSTTGLHPLAANYLHRLERAARRLPRRDRRELVAEVGNHLSETTYAGMSDAEALTVLDRLGEPEEIVEAEQPDAVAEDPRGIQEWAAIILLMLGGFIFGVGWIVGLILLWSSRAWTTGQKVIGTFVVPGGLAAALFVAGIGLIGVSQTCGTSGPVPNVVHCSGGSGTTGTVVFIALFAFLLIGPFCTAVYLARTAR